jgi:hypothetical protein
MFGLPAAWAEAAQAATEDRCERGAELKEEDKCCFDRRIFGSENVFDARFKLLRRAAEVRYHCR